MAPGSEPKAELGLTDFDGGLLGSESEVGALCVGTYWFARGVYEITLHPRPASFRLRRTVETDHPRVGRRVTFHTVELSKPFRVLHDYRTLVRHALFPAQTFRLHRALGLALVFLFAQSVTLVVILFSLGDG